MEEGIHIPEVYCQTALLWSIGNENIAQLRFPPLSAMMLAFGLVVVWGGGSLKNNLIHKVACG